MAHTQDISLHVDEDSHASLGERLLTFFQPETLEGDNSYWCNTCIRPRRATKSLSYTHAPTVLIIHLKRLILGRKIQVHVPFDMILEMKPFLVPGPISTLRMELIGIVTHQGTKDQGHYVAITKRGNKWFSYSDAIVTQVTVAELLQTQAYILIYRRIEQDEGTGTQRSRNSATIQNSTIKKPKLSHKMEFALLASLTPGPRRKIPDQNTPYQQISSGGATPQPSLTYEEGLLEQYLVIRDTLPTTRPDPQVLANRGEGEVGGTGWPTGDLILEPANLPPPDTEELGQSEGVRRDQFEHDNTCSPQTTLTLQNRGSKTEDAVVGAEEPGGDPTLKPV